METVSLSFPPTKSSQRFTLMVLFPEPSVPGPSAVSVIGNTSETQVAEPEAAVPVVVQVGDGDTEKLVKLPPHVTCRTLAESSIAIIEVASTGRARRSAMSVAIVPKASRRVVFVMKRPREMTRKGV